MIEIWHGWLVGMICGFFIGTSAGPHWIGAWIGAAGTALWFIAILRRRLHAIKTTVQCSKCGGRGHLAWPHADGEKVTA